MMSGLRHLYINKKRLVEVNSMCGRVCVNTSEKRQGCIYSTAKPQFFRPANMRN
jgi:hypothetical protein